MKQTLLIIGYLAAIVAANLLVAAFGVTMSIVNAFLFIGLDLASRDALHDIWRTGRWWKMLTLIVSGGAISYALNQGAGIIAVASCAAFVLSGAVDWLIYHLLRKYAYLLRANGSNLGGAFVDSLVFPTIAFGGLDWMVTLAQFGAKVAGGFVWSLILRRRHDLPSAV